MRKVFVAAIIALAVLGAALVLVPFNRPQPGGGFTYGPGFSTHCSSPVVSWRVVDHESGWFGYTPLTSTPPAFPTCRGEARHRLAWGCSALAGAVVLTIVLRRRRRDVGSAEATTPSS